MKKIYIPGLLCLSICSLFAQGSGWTSGQGKGYFKLEERILSASQQYNKYGKKENVSSVAFLTTSFYGQLGVTDRIDINAYVPFLVIIDEASMAKVNSVQKPDDIQAGDARVGLKYSMTRSDRLASSVGIQLGIPMGSSPQDEIEAALPQVGSRDVNQSLHTDLGLSLWPVPGYASAGISYKNRTRSLSDEVSWYLNSGIFLLKELSVKAELSALYSLKNGTREGWNTEYLVYGAEFSLRFLPKIGISVGTSFFADGRLTLAGPTLYGGFYFTP